METKSHLSDLPKPKLARRVFRWVFLVASAVALFISGYELVMRLAFHSTHVPRSPAEALVFLLIHIIAALFLLALVFPLLRGVLKSSKAVHHLRESLFTWRNARRTLVGLAIFATLLAIFYAEENWRGQRAWEQCKRDLEAKGEVLDWAAYIPAPIPDDKNIIKAPRMAEWFVRPGQLDRFTNSLGPNLNPDALLKSAVSNAKTPILMARLVVGAANPGAANPGDLVIPFDAPNAPELFSKLAQDMVGPTAKSPQGWTFVQHPFSQIKPSRVWVRSDKRLSIADLSFMFSGGLVPFDVGQLRVEADTDPGSYRLVLAAQPVIFADEYLAWSRTLEPEINQIREALKRPHLRMDGDYQRPFEMPIVNFVNIRNVAQAAATRAQCCLLLGRSEQAFGELSLIFGLRRLLVSEPTTLVAAMINVAISGLYADTLADGFRLQAWREPELAALQKQLQQINLPPAVTDSFRGQRAGVCQTFQIVKAGEIAEVFSFGGQKPGLWEKLTSPAFLFFKFAPRGWIYQNLATVAALEQTAIRSYHPASQILDPRKAEDGAREVETLSSGWNPYTVLARFAIPNFSRAAKALAYNQTRVNEAFVACGLERYRGAHGDYPESLDTLVPLYIEKLPHDLIGGQSLKYRRTNEGMFLLYSVGWNETDEGGMTTSTNSVSINYDRPDWVWRSPAR